MLDRIKWTAETGLHLQGAVCGAVDGAVRLFISAFGRSDRDPAIIALNSDGTVFWKREFSRDQGAVSLSVQPAFVRPAGEPALICSIVGDGKNELIVPCADGRILCLATEGKADAPWEVAARGQSRCGAA